MIIKHEKIDTFKDIRNALILKEVTFKTVNTKRSKSIIKGDVKTIFTDSGEPDYVALNLINAVRRDAAVANLPKRKTPIYWYKYKDQNGFFNPAGEVHKIDLNSAYWSFARNAGLVSDKTHCKFLELAENMTDKAAKKLRLKALGSLATTKVTSLYLAGVLQHKATTIYRQPTFDSYMHICALTDELMNNLLMLDTGGLYYYWDCIFTNTKEAATYVKTAINEAGFDYSEEIDAYRILREPDYAGIKVDKKDHIYPIKNEEIADIWEQMTKNKC